MVRLKAKAISKAGPSLDVAAAPQLGTGASVLTCGSHLRTASGSALVRERVKCGKRSCPE